MSQLHSANLHRSLLFSLTLLIGWGIRLSPAQAGRYVLNQPFETIEQYFGHHLTESITPHGDETWTERSYANSELRRLLPTLPSDAQFNIIFVDGKAQWIILAPVSGLGIPVEDPEWHDFHYDQTAAFNFFEYIFGYRPSRYEPVPGYYGGGHEGFYDQRLCLGDGIQTTYTEYILGVSDVQLSYALECEPLSR